MIDPRLGWFAMGATCGMILCGFPWHLRFSRYIRPARRPGPYSSSARGIPPPPPGTRREYLYSPATMAECGGTCCEEWDPRACDCGALWRDVAARWPTIYVEDFPPGYWDDGIPPNLPSRLGSNPPPPGCKPDPPASPPVKPQPAGGRLVREDRLDPNLPL